MSSPLDQILGLGYSGYASIDGSFFPLLPSSVTENENALSSEAAMSGLSPFAVGDSLIRNRRSLSISLHGHLNRNTVFLMHNLTYDWRNLTGVLDYHAIKVIISNLEGYSSNEAYVDQLTVSAPNGDLCSIQIDMTCFTWVDLFAAQGTPVNGRAFDPTLAIYKPIPSWDTNIINTAMGGATTEWDLGFENGWEFRQLCEGTGGAPTPRMVTPGPLQVRLNQTTLAQRNSPPGERGSAQILIGGVTVPQTKITLPTILRNPQKQRTNLGNQDGVVLWSASFQGIGPLPVTG